ncbi:hypothetical protein PMIN06_003941 [Paraphaeosphaeria minitans]
MSSHSSLKSIMKLSINRKEGFTNIGRHFALNTGTQIIEVEPFRCRQYFSSGLNGECRLRKPLPRQLTRAKLHWSIGMLHEGAPVVYASQQCSGYPSYLGSLTHAG